VWVSCADVAGVLMSLTVRKKAGVLRRLSGPHSPIQVRVLFAVIHALDRHWSFRVRSPNEGKIRQVRSDAGTAVCRSTISRYERDGTGSQCWQQEAKADEMKE